MKIYLWLNVHHSNTGLNLVNEISLGESFQVIIRALTNYEDWTLSFIWCKFDWYYVLYNCQKKKSDTNYRLRMSNDNDGSSGGSVTATFDDQYR